MKAWSFGSFFSSFAIPANLQKRLVSFLLQRAIGHFLEDSLDVEKLDIELSNGIVHLTDLKLNSKALNDLVAGTPLAVTNGSIRSITATIPLRNLWNGQCVLEIDGIDITLAPVQAQPDLAQDLEEQLLSSSVNLANEFLKQRGDGKQEEELGKSILQSFQHEALHTPSGFPGDFNYRAPQSAAAPANHSQPDVPGAWGTDSTEGSGDTTTEGEGIQLVAKLIEKLLARIQVICRGTTLRLRHSSKLPLTGEQARRNSSFSASSTTSADKDEPKLRDYELVVQLPFIAYRDETPGWAPTGNVDSSVSGTSSISSSSSTLLEESTTIPSVIWQDAPESIKTVVFRGFSVWIRERDNSSSSTSGASTSPSSLSPGTATQSAGTPLQPTQSRYPSTSEDGAVATESTNNDTDDSDSDNDVFMDAQETVSRSVASSQYISRSTMLSASTRLDQSRFLQRTDSTASPTQPTLYEAQIVSCLQHKNRVKVSIRKNASLSTGTVVRSLVDMDVQLKSLFVALSPNQIGFLLEILLAIEAAAPSSTTSEPPLAMSGRSSGMANPGMPPYREMPRGAGGAATYHGPSSSSWGTQQQQGKPNRGDAMPAPTRNAHRPDEFFDRRSSMESQRSASPHGPSPMTGIRSPSHHQYHSHYNHPDRVDPGARYSEQDVPMRRGGGQRDASSSSSHRMPSDSMYAGRSTLLPAPALSSTNASSLSVKIKARLPTFQVYILLQDPASMHEVPTEATFFSNPRPETLRCNHIKIELDNLVLRCQQWRLPVSSGVSPVNHSQPSPAHHHPHQQQYQQQQQQQHHQQPDMGRPKRFTKKSQIDFTLSKVLVAEWIDKQTPVLTPINDLGRPVREYHQRAYRTLPLKQYIPLVEFDPELESLAPEQGGGSKFCTLAMPSRYLSERASTLRSKNERRKQERVRMDGGGTGGTGGGAGNLRHPAASLADLRGMSSSRAGKSGKPGESFHPGSSASNSSSGGATGSSRADSPVNHSVTKEVIRMRVMLGGKKDQSSSSSSSSSSSTSSDTGYAQDVIVEVKPLQVHVDFSTFQRMEPVLQRFMIFSASRQTTATTPSQPQRPTRPAADPSMGWSSSHAAQEQQIMEDLDRHHQQQQLLATKPRTRFRLRLNTVRIWISVPDMAATLAGAKDTGPGARSIYDMLALDISKLVVTQSSDMVRAAALSTSGSVTAVAPGASKFKVEFSNFSAFIIQEHAVQAKAILSITSLPTAAANMSGFNSALPNLEITSKPVESIMTSASTAAPPAMGPAGRRSTKAGGGDTTTLPHAFNIFEGEENVHNVVNEEAELIQFRQRTIETSQLVINCQFPLVAAHLEKEVFDTLQLRANDMQTWIALFSEKLAADVQACMPQPAPSAMAEDNAPPDFSSSVDGQEGVSGDIYGSYRHGADMTGAPSDDGQLDKDDVSEHGTDRSTAYGEELRMLAAEGLDPAARLRTSTARDYLARLQSIVRPTMASVVVSIQTVDALLHYPTSPTVLDPIPTVKSYQLTTTDARVFAAVKYQGSTDTYLCLETEGLELWEVTAQKPKVTLLLNTIPKNVKVKAPKPMFFMAAILSMDVEANYKESNINLTFAGISWKFSIEQTAVDDVQDFFTEPKGIVYWNLPQQCTRVNVNLVDCCMDYKPLHIPTRFVLSFDRMKVAATLRLESPTLTSKIQIHNMSLFLLDNVEYLLRPHHPSDNTSGPGIDPVMYWTSLGFVSIGQCPFFELVSVKSRNGQLPLYDLTITNQIFYLDTCSDSLQALMVFVSYMGENGDLPPEKKQILERLAEAERAANRAKSNVIYQDVLASLDEEAFKHRPIVTSETTLATGASESSAMLTNNNKSMAGKGVSRDRQRSGSSIHADDQLEVVEEFYAVDRDDTDHEVIRVQESPDLDGFHEVYADVAPPRSASSSSRTQTSATASKVSSKSKSRDLSLASSPSSRSTSPPTTLMSTGSHLNSNSPLVASNMSLSPTKDYFGRDMRRTPSSSSSKSRTGSGGGSRSLGQVEEGVVRLLDAEFKGFRVIENYYSVPVLTEEEQRQRRPGGYDGDTNAITKVRIRVRDFNFCWRLFDGLDFESSRMREEEAAAEQRRRTWHAASATGSSGHHRSYPEDTRLGDHHHHPHHASVGGGDNVFDRLSREYGRHHHHPRYSPGSSEADSTVDDYQSDTMSQASSRRPTAATAGGGGSSSTSSSRRPAHLSPHGGGSRTSGRRSSIRSTTSTTAGRSSLERSSRSMMEIRAEKVRVDFEDYVSGIERALSLSLRVKEFEILDNLQTSLWRKFLASQRPDSHKATPRLTQSSMVRLDLVGVRPVVAASTVEYRIKVRVLPLRLYIDQDALMFLIRFFVQSAGGPDSAAANPSSASHDGGASGGVAGAGAGAGHGDMAAAPSAPERKKPSDLYFQSISVGTIALKMDYKPKHVDYTGLSGGNLVELMNFFHLEGAEMTLQEVRLRGISGIPKIGQELISLWLPHIRSTQVPHMVSGLTPIRSLVNVGSGIADLVLLPIEQYKKDGHLIKGLQKGGKAFTRATTLEALKIGTKLAVGTQVLLEHADDIFGSSRSAGGASGASGGSGSASGKHHDGPSEGYDAHGRRLVATMVSDHEAYMEESFEGEDQLFARWGQDPQAAGGMYDVESLSGGSTSGGGGGSGGLGTSPHRVSKYANQPADVNEGMELAYKSLSKNFGAAAHTIFAVPMEVYERAGAQGSVRAVIRAVPVAVLKPMIGATEAFSKVLIGLRNSIDPAQRLQMEDKYKRP